MLATQNPYEFEGTYVLPGEPARSVHDPAADGLPHPLGGAQGLRQPSRRRAGRDARAGPDSAEDVLLLQRAVRTVQVDDAIGDYLLDIVHATRRSEDLHVGVSTRGALTLYRAAQSLAMVSGRNYVIPDDVKTLVVPVLAHRVVGKSFLQAGEFGAAEAIIRDIVDRIRVPT